MHLAVFGTRKKIKRLRKLLEKRKKIWEAQKTLVSKQPGESDFLV